MKNSIPKFLVVFEVLVVRFICTPLLTLGIYRLFPGFEAWQTGSVGFAFPVFGDVVMVGLALAVILLRRKTLGSYGIDFKNIPYHLDVAAACFIPFVLSSMPLGLGVDHRTWSGALILAAVQIGLLVVLGLVLQKKPAPPTPGILALSILIGPSVIHSSGATVGKAVAIFLTYALFVGFGEEIMYRGYIQSRLNEVFGKPYCFFGVGFGWGGMIAALLFGLSHSGVIGWILNLPGEVTLAWGFWTCFGGLVFGFVREKTGSILTPSLLHGLPQAIASVLMLYF